jgi:hypothetical protein
VFGVFQSMLLSYVAVRAEEVVSRVGNHPILGMKDGVVAVFFWWAFVWWLAAIPVEGSSRFGLYIVAANE